jgi:DNA ligase (NAD+)
VYDENEIDSSFMVQTVKIDGSNLSVTYDEQGNLLHALTRGDGERGEDVTHLVPYIESIPERATPGITVVGEVVTDREDISNFRNFVSGSLGVKDAQDIKHRALRFIVHDVLGVEENYTARVSALHGVGFVSPFNWDCSSYPSDGQVFRVDDWRTERKLGSTSKYPRFAVALKVRAAMTASTTIQDIVWSLGRTGVVTPVAVVEPVVIDDATISRVILHNIEFIEEHDLGLGDEILIERQITPQFVSTLSKSSFPRFSVADAEQRLGMSLRREGPKLFASESDGRKSVEYFVKQLGIKGLGPAWIEKLGLTHPSELFDESVEWEHMGRNGDKVLTELSRPKPYDLVLGSLGIPGVGKSTARTIIEKIPSFERLRDIQYESIRGIGPKTVDSILAWLDVNEDWVTKLPYDLATSGNDANQDIDERIVVAISGKIDMTKQDLKDHLEDHGVILKDSVTKQLDYLISSGEETTKVEKAKKYGIPIINYWENKMSILKGEFHGGSN